MTLRTFVSWWGRISGMSYDARIGANFLKAGIGYGGSCFPKDTKALKYLAKQYGYQLKTVEAAVDVNAVQKTRLYQKACKRMITFEGLKVALLGPSLNFARFIRKGVSAEALSSMRIHRRKRLRALTSALCLRSGSRSGRLRRKLLRSGCGYRLCMTGETFLMWNG